MENQNLPCPRCPKVSHSISELTTHLRSVHRFSESEINNLRGRGYFEDKVATRDGEVAINHRDAAVRAQASNAINIPFVPPPSQKKQVNLPAGWQKTLEGFQYEKLISQTHSIDSIIKKVLKGSVIANHAILELYVYQKEIGELLELEKQERLLDAQLGEGVAADTEYLERVPHIADKLLKVKEKIKAIKRDVGLDTEKDILIEEWFSGDLNTNEHIEWEEGFMQKALLEAEQVHEPKQEIKL